MTFKIIKKTQNWKHETRVVFMYGEVWKGASKNSATFKMELSPFKIC